MSKTLDACNIIDRVSDELESLGHAFMKTGNERVADELYQWALELATEVKTIRNDYTNTLDDRLRDSKNIVGGLLKASLVGALRNADPAEVKKITDTVDGITVS